MQDKQFTKVEEEYFRLKGKLAAGRITREQFDAALKSLMFQDAQGRWWMMGADSGKWFVHDGQTWVEAEPYAVSSPAPMPPPELPERGRPPSLPERAAPRYAPSQPPPLYPPPEHLAPRGRTPTTWMLAIGGAILAVVVCACVALFALSGLPTTVSQIPSASPLPTPPPQPLGTPPIATVTPPVPGTPARVIASYESRLLTPQEFTTNAENLAAAVADLNRAQLQFIQDAKTWLAKENRERVIGLAIPLFADPNTERLDQDLREIAARAMKVGRLADDLARTMASQDNGSAAAAKMAEPYTAVGRMAYALVIEAQNLRDDLAKGSLKRADAVSRIAEYGARLWNARVSGLDPNAKPVAGAVNPFVAEMTDSGGISPLRYLSASAAQQLKTQLGNKNPRLWLAVAQDPITRTLSIPAPVKPVGNVFDPVLLDKLTNPAEQVDADRARQAVAAQLDPRNPSGARQVQIALKTAAVADKDAIAAAVIPSFDRGTGTTASLQKGVLGGDDLSDDISALSGIEAPKPDDSKLIIPADKLIALSIGNVSVGEVWVGNDAADVTIFFNVEWNARIMPSAGSALLIQCASPNGLLPLFEPKVRTGIFTDNTGLTRIPYPGEVALTCKSFIGYLNEDPRFSSSVSITVHIGKEGTPTATATPTATLTTPSTRTRPVTPAPTSAATGTRTSTRTATAIPTPSPAFTMNGTFSIKWARGYYTSGSIKVTVDPTAGTASAFMNGAGTYSGENNRCPPNARNYTARRTFEGTLKGTVNPQSGELVLTGQLPGQVSMTGSCSDDTLGLPADLSLSGTVDLKNHTAKGKVLSTGSFDAGEGDWHAGE
ncbi:MAG: hypothetical protein HY741_12970 [Chloroflexi bacterium]|nr:hypothetical protein [Chloroflexota bacterium]